MAVLQVVEGLTPGQLFRIDGDEAVLGRHPDCDVVLDVGAISRRHARIILDGGDYYVEDLGSRNGTLVNDEVIESPRRLEENDRVKICDLSFTFHRDAPVPESGLRLEDPPTAAALLVDDANSSSIMSKLDVSVSHSGLRMSVNPETKLRAIIEISENLGKALSLDQVLAKTLDSLFKIFVQADRGFVVLQDRDTGNLIPRAVKHRREGNDESPRISKTIVRQAMDSREAILSADAENDSRFNMSQSIADFHIRSMMCAPLIDSDGNSIGVIQIDTLDQRNRFATDDLDVLAGVSRQASLAVDNANLHDAALRQQAIERELKLARQVQQSFLPDTSPEVAGYSFFDFYEPAQRVGGDYFDYVELPGGRVGVVLADVSGKGIAAALLMAKLSSEVRFALVTETCPAAAIKRVNASLVAQGLDDRFVTLVLALLDTTSHRLTLVNAGHMAPLLRHATGDVEEIGEEASGIPLGIDDEFEYESVEVELAAGDMLSMFTDGISEAMSPDGSLYGLERLRKRVTQHVTDVPALGAAILDDVRKFVRNRPQSDDMCIACVGRNLA
ncbi:MAG: SpoIIE family protein phosphatase [Pirellulales bacterium]